MKTYCHFKSLNLCLLSILLASLGSVAVRAQHRFTNSVGLVFVHISPGDFQMGSTEGDHDERPVHQVTLTRPFAMATTEVSNEQFEQFAPEHKSWRAQHQISSGDNDAVVFVSWYEAVAFCKWLSEKEGKPYRLPTEAEWEYACRAGTVTPYSTGETLPEPFHKNQKQVWEPVAVSLRVGQTPPNPWGLRDMHGNVEEWCHDWFGPYLSDQQIDPTGPAHGDFKVTRGGSHSTPVFYLRSANRSGTLPEDKHWLIGFRVVQADAPEGAASPMPAAPLWASDVSQKPAGWKSSASTQPPVFIGPREFVKIPPGSDGPLYSKHNHQPAISACPNGDLIAIWYTCRTEAGRELAVAASRLRNGAQEWDAPSIFWDAPDRNDHGNAIWWDGKSTIYHFNGLSTDGTWGKLALLMRTSTDNGVSWSPARIIGPEHRLRHQVIAGVFQTEAGEIVLPCDAVTGGNGGTAIHMSPDGGVTWSDPGKGRPTPEFKESQNGAWIAGIHAGVVEIQNGALMALGRGDSIDGQMPKSISRDGGRTWTYSASGLPPLGSGQRLVLRRLNEGPLFLASFATAMTFTNASGNTFEGKGLFAALSYDDGNTWSFRRLLTDGRAPQKLDGGGNTREFILSATTAEPRGYLAGTQTPDGLIHLISSKQHYTFNAAWIREGQPNDRH